MQTREAMARFLKSCRARGLSEDTLRWYQGILNHFADSSPKLPKKPEPVEEFIASCTAGDERRHGYFRALRAFFRYMERRHHHPNPMRLIDPPHRKHKFPHELTLDELDQLLSYPHKPKIRAALLFLADTGCRIGELYGITPSDLSITPWGPVAKVSGKTGMRLVPLSPQTFDSLMNALPFGVSKYRMRRLISNAFREAKVRGSAHILRHTFGTLWEGDETVLQHIMGHSSIATTIIYRHTRTRRLSEQHKTFTPLKMLATAGM